MKTGYECTAYFKGIDGLGNCDDECRWWHDGACPCAKGSEAWDGKEHYYRWWDKKDEQAYQQIKEMIQKPNKKRGLTGMAGEIFNEVHKNQPKVTEEWIQEKAEDTASDYPDVAFPNLITIFKKLLKEAGVHV